MSKHILICFFLFTPFLKAYSFDWFDLTLGVGLNVAENNRPGNTAKYFDGAYSIEPLPMVLFRVGPLVFSAEGAGLAVVFFKNFKIIGSFFYDGEPYNAKGMLFERRRSVFAGGVIQFYHFLLMGFQDIQGRSNGRMLRLVSKPEFNITDKWSFSPRMYVQYWDQKYVDYYYGVLPEEADPTIGRPAYTGGDALNYGFVLRNIFKIGGLKYLFAPGLKYYGNSVYKSPTMSINREYRVHLGIIAELF